MSTSNIPTHVAIMMDGNRRWATEHGLPKMMGHTEGGKNLKKIVLAAVERKIPYLTLWALSTENFNRSQEELGHIFSLAEKLIDYEGFLMENNIQFRYIGNIALLPQRVQDVLRSLVEKTRQNTGLVGTLAIAYGGKDDIVRAVRKIVEKGMPASEITEEVIANHLDTVGIPDVDLIIRTGGAIRFSNFLLWQSTYAEMYFTSTYWPAFDAAELDRALEWYSKQERRMGK